MKANKNISINYLLSTEIAHFFVSYGKLLFSLLSPLHGFLPLLIQTTFSTLCRQSFSLFCWRKPGIICLVFFSFGGKVKISLTSALFPPQAPSFFWALLHCLLVRGQNHSSNNLDLFVWGENENYCPGGTTNPTRHPTRLSSKSLRLFASPSPAILMRGNHSFLARR